jgi:hypothetical protein
MFLLNFDCASELQEFDLQNWVRRYNRNADPGLRYTDMVNCFQTMSPYVRTEDCSDLSSSMNSSRSQLKENSSIVSKP